MGKRAGEKERHKPRMRLKSSKTPTDAGGGPNVLPAQEESLREFLTRLHLGGAPRVLIILCYYAMVAFPLVFSDLVDSVEVFAGDKAYTEACCTPWEPIPGPIIIFV